MRKNCQDDGLKGKGHTQESARINIRMMYKDTAQGTSEAS